MATDVQRAKVLSSLKDYKRKYMKKEFSELDESATRIMINAFLTEVLGYQELDEIKTEYNIKGVYADYVVQLNRKKQFVVEVKSIQLDLNERHLRQSLGYAANEGIDWIILTNGRSFQFYRVIFEKPISYELVASIEFEGSTPNTLRGFADLLTVFTKRDVMQNEHEDFWRRTKALSPENISKLLYTESVIRLVKRELKESTGISFEPDAIRIALKGCLEKAIDTGVMRFKAKKVVKPVQKSEEQPV